MTLDGANKVDFFCDARNFIYEWEEWNNSAGLTDKTQQLYTLIKDITFAVKDRKAWDGGRNWKWRWDDAAICA